MNQSSERRPLLLLDVDGVLNAFPERATSQFTRHHIDGYPIHLHAEVRGMVSALDQAFEIVWFTLWNHRATPGIGPHVGLDGAAHFTTSWERGWEAALASGYRDKAIRNLMYAKTPLLPELVGRRRHWVWIDDAHSGWDHEYLVRAGFDATRFRLVRTDPQVGLTWDDVERANGFARAVAAGMHVDAGVERAQPRSSTPLRPGAVAGRVDAVTDPSSP